MVVASDEELHAGILVRAGLRRVTTLWYLHRDLREPTDPPVSRLTFMPYDPDDPTYNDATDELAYLFPDRTNPYDLVSLDDPSNY